MPRTTPVRLMTETEPEHPPLWGGPSQAQRPVLPDPRGGHWARWGIMWGSLALLIMGSGPLAIFMIVDPPANPVGPGILAMFTFWPALFGFIGGLAWGSYRTWGFKRS